jgi:SH3-like domain-containing protein
MREKVSDICREVTQIGLSRPLYCGNIRSMKLFAYVLVFMVTGVGSSAFALCVSANQANLREGPSTQAKLVWTVGKYMPLMPIEQKGAWVQVKDLDGQKMWIYSSLVTNDFDCMAVRVSKANLRKGPGVKYPKTPLGFAHKYMPFKKIRRDGAWLQVQDDYGFKHWVVENNIWEPLNYTQLSY